MFEFFKNIFKNEEVGRGDVYCEECRHFKESDIYVVTGDPEFFHECSHPMNLEELMTQGSRESRYRARPSLIKIRKKHPSELNEFNSCRYFDKK